MRMSKITVERKGRIATLFGLRMFRIAFGVSIGFIVLTIGLPLWRLFPGLYGQQVVPLHYNIHYGVDWTGVWWQIFTLPALGVLFVTINTLGALWFVKRDIVLTRIALFASVILTAFLFLAMVFVVSLNIVYG